MRVGGCRCCLPIGPDRSVYGKFCSHNRFHRTASRRVGEIWVIFVCHESQPLAHLLTSTGIYYRVLVFVSDFLFALSPWNSHILCRSACISLHFGTFYNGSQYFILITVAHLIINTTLFLRSTSFSASSVVLFRRATVCEIRKEFNDDDGGDGIEH
jgi:hypothetical protein